MALIVGGTTVTGTQVLDATKLSGTLPALDGSSLVSLNASELDSGTVANARISSGSVTQHVTATTQANGTWTLGTPVSGVTIQSSQYVRVGKLVSVQAWGRGNGRTYPDNYNTNRFYFTGLPITSMNTGTSSDCVGFGHWRGRSGESMLWVLSNSSQIRVGSGSSMTVADSNSVGSTANSMNQSGFNTNYSNVDQDLHNTDAVAHWCLHLEYYVD